jgi:fatty-acid desaturase
LAWYELDITWLHILLLKKLGIAQNVKTVTANTRLPERAAAA